MNDATSEPAGEELPEVVRRYQEAHDRRDIEVALSTFTPDARVLDDGQEFRGYQQIRHWLDSAASEFTFTRSLVRAEAVDARRWLVVNHLEGDFPGGVVDLRYQFELAGGLITQLVIAP